MSSISATAPHEDSRQKSSRDWWSTPPRSLATSRCATALDDFDVNAVGTLNMLEAAHRHAPSTNKVYGDGPNSIGRSWRRVGLRRPDYADGIKEDFPIDQTKHSVFGASKVAADVMVQEYRPLFRHEDMLPRRRYCTRGRPSGVELHGFPQLPDQVQHHTNYKIFGYKGKQVRETIHSYDVARFIHAFYEAPRYGEVYNLGGGRGNSISILEAFERIAAFSGGR